jgi:hypothetical protein
MHCAAVEGAGRASLSSGKDGHHDQGHDRQQDPDQAFLGTILLDQIHDGLDSDIRRKGPERCCYQPNRSSLDGFNVPLVSSLTPETPDQDRGRGRLDYGIQSKTDKRDRAGCDPGHHPHESFENVPDQREVLEPKTATQPLGSVGGVHIRVVVMFGVMVDMSVSRAQVIDSFHSGDTAQQLLHDLSFNAATN